LEGNCQGAPPDPSCGPGDLLAGNQTLEAEKCRSPALLRLFIQYPRKSNFSSGREQTRVLVSFTVSFTAEVGDNGRR
jgi:hypothetical protein